MCSLCKFFVLVLVLCSNLCGSDDPSQNGTNDQDAVELMDKLSHSWRQFQSFRQKFEKKYASTEQEEDRFRIFKQNLKKIERLNAAEAGTAVYGITEMADWSKDEFLAKRATLRSTEIAENSKFMKKMNFSEPDDEDPIPEEFDWRSVLTVTSVKDQKDCGSCWAFASVGNVENLYAIKTGFLRDFSVQQLIDCSKDGSACGGGDIDSGYLSMLEVGGLVPESDYPYYGYKRVCDASGRDVVVNVTGYVLFFSNENGMARFIAKHGSTANALNAELLQFYDSGVIVGSDSDSGCSRDALNHMVLVVGYGRDWMSGLEYWLVKNSWGRDWGESGYFKIARGNNTCGIASVISSAVL